MNFVFPAPPTASVPVLDSEQRFPVHRIYCVGRNYADHAKEMGAEVNRSQPVFFLKPADAIVTDGGDVPYPSATNDLHHEVEMIVALRSGGRDIPVESALHHVYGYGVGLDLTRRDLQAVAKAKSLPWDVAKAFDASAPVSALRAVNAGAHPQHATLSLLVNDEPRQNSDISEMIFTVAEIIHELSKLFELAAGVPVKIRSPAGVAALARGDTFEATLGGVASLRGRIV
jgi:fumarylpyruvate hydrolase